MIVQSNPSLEFVAAPALAPAEVQVDAALMEVYNKELAAVSYPFSSMRSNDPYAYLRPKLFPFLKKMTTCDSIPLSHTPHDPTIPVYRCCRLLHVTRYTQRSDI